MEPSTHLWFLGAPRADYAGQPIRSFESRKAFVLLGYLANHGVALPRVQLAALFWPDHSDERARSNLRSLLHNLTSLLPGCLAVDRQTVRLLGPAVVWTDTVAFEELASQNTLIALAAAAELYRSAFLDGLYLDDCPEVEAWLTQQREHWHERIAHVLTELAARAHERQEWVAGLRSVDRLLALDPWREAAHQHKMRLLALSGQRDNALAQYEICRRVLADELGLDPSSETTALYEQIRDGLLAQPTPHRRLRGQIPLPLTTVLGRADEHAWVTCQLASSTCRLITLVGPGGIGKTRLALDIIDGLQDTFAEIAFVDLTRVSEPGQVITAIALSLAVREVDEQSLLQSVKAYLLDRPVLLLLDNFEHVLAGALLVAELLADCPNLKVLATSREELHLRGEQVFPVPPLALPDSQTDPGALADVAAVALFVERAIHHQPTFTLTSDNAIAVAEICRQLDGLPLAIELAAARIRLFPPDLLLQRLSNRLQLLTRGPHDLPTRQQTLQNTLDWSYNLLQASEQTLFACLAIFVGGWSISAAEAICHTPAVPKDTVLDILQGLLDKQLIYQESPSRSEARYTMLGTIREYALARLAQLADAPEIRQRHAVHYVALAAIVAPEYQERPDNLHLATLDVEFGNLFAALQWTLEREDSNGSLRLCNALAHYWDIHGHLSEARQWLSRGLALPDATPGVIRAIVLEAAGRLAVEHGDWSQAASLFSQALQLSRMLGERQRIALLLRSQGWLALARGEYGQAAELLEESLLLYRSLNDQLGVSRVLGLQGQAAYEQSAFAEAIPLLTESLALSQALHDPIDAAWSINKLGLVAFYKGDVAEADRLLNQSLAMFQGLNYTRGIAWILGSLGMVRLAQATYTPAAELLAASLARYRELGEKRNIAFSLERLASLASVQGRAIHAARLFGAAAALRKTRSVPLPPVDQAHYAPYITRVQTLLGADQLEAAWAYGATLSSEEAVAYALENKPRTQPD